jgi:hypothetical protein
MAITIPKEVHEREFNKLKEEYEREFGSTQDSGSVVYYDKLEMAHSYAMNLLFWSSRVVHDPSQLRGIDDVARRAICENSEKNLRAYVDEKGILRDVDDILSRFKETH